MPMQGELKPKYMYSVRSLLTTRYFLIKQYVPCVTVSVRALLKAAEV